jgi:hypothetical protein
MAIPHELLYPTAEESADGHAEETGAHAPEPVLLPKGGVKWPWDEPVPFLQGPDFEQLKWGGFEADVIGVRKNLISHVRRLLFRLSTPLTLPSDRATSSASGGQADSMSMSCGRKRSGPSSLATYVPLARLSGSAFT